jgi:hypothetical protein
VTSDRLGRLSFVASVVAALAAAVQFVGRMRRDERRRTRRRLLTAELDKLTAIRRRIEECADAAEARGLIAEADDLLCSAELDAGADRLDSDGIQSLRSLHALCWRALEQRSTARPDA